MQIESRDQVTDALRIPRGSIVRFAREQARRQRDFRVVGWPVRRLQSRSLGFDGRRVAWDKGFERDVR